LDGKNEDIWENPKLRLAPIFNGEIILELTIPGRKEV
jgi:hypothetical protein